MTHALLAPPAILELMTSALGERGGRGRGWLRGSLKPILFPLCLSQHSVDRCGSAPRARSEWALAVGSPPARLARTYTAPATLRSATRMILRTVLSFPERRPVLRLDGIDDSGNLPGVLKMNIHSRNKSEILITVFHSQDSRSFSRTENSGILRMNWPF